MTPRDDPVVLLTSSDPKNPSFGTGFVFHRDATGRAFLLTCLHVVEALEKRARDSDVETPEVRANGLPAEVWVRGDGMLDLAVLAVEGLAVESLRLGTAAERGREVEALGYSEHEPGQGTVLSRPLPGTVRDRPTVRSRLRPARIGAHALDIEIDVEAFRELKEGYSGSPVLDARTRRVVGIMNLRLGKDRGQALCVASCDLFDPPLSERLPDYPSEPVLHTEAQTADADFDGALDWLAATLDHDGPIERMDECLDSGGTGPLFYAFDACLADCPRALAEHLAVRYGGPGRWSGANQELFVDLVPDRWDRNGLWKALIAKITPPGTGHLERIQETERVVDWINAGGAGLRVLYCQIPLADKAGRATAFIRGALHDFGDLPGILDGAGLLVLFCCLHAGSGLDRILDLWRRYRLRACPSLGAMQQLRASDLDTWLGRMEHPLPGAPQLDAAALKELRAELEPLFPDDSVRRRYRDIRRPALQVLARAVQPDT